MRLLRWLLILCGLAAGLGLAEAGLRVAEKFRTREFYTAEYMRPDPVLGYRLTEGTPGHDAAGFRNASVPATADVVALGDSQTWGVNAGRDQTWPQQLARATGRTVYSMALGGYGPVQYYALAERALALRPRVVVVGLYLGNDLYEAYKLTYTNDNYAWLRSRPPDALRDTVAERSAALQEEEKRFHTEYSPAGVSGWLYRLQTHTATGRLLGATGLWPGADDAWYMTSREWARRNPDKADFYEDGHSRTVLLTAYRLTGLDLDDPAVAEGLRITREILPRLRAKTDAAGARLVVLLIPSKESVYADALTRQRGGLSETHARLVGMEARARAEILSVCERTQTECVDALPALASAVARREQLYPATTDSHPNPRGYSVLAAAVADALRRRGW